MLNKNERMEALRKNGMDTSKYFTLVVNEGIPAGSRINISVENGSEVVKPSRNFEEDMVGGKPSIPEAMNGFVVKTKAEVDKLTEDEIAKRILQDGYVRNTKLHRRFVAAQYMRMLESDRGWYGYLNTYYGYAYQFDMMFEEVRVLSKLEVRDRETFNERSQFFTNKVVCAVLKDYIKDVKTYIDGLDIKHCKGRPYVKITGYGNVFTDEIDSKIITPLEAMYTVCERSKTYGKLYNNLMSFKDLMIKVPYGTKKSKVWVDAFQREGAFYTLKNLIMFHDVRLFSGGRFYDMYEGMSRLNSLAKIYEGYQLNALLKETIKKNDFNFRQSIEAHK